MNIALKEAKETDNWIDVMYEAEYLTLPDYESLKYDNNELIAIRTATI